MFLRVVSLLLLLSLPTDSYALRQAGVESEPTRQVLSNALSAGMEEKHQVLVADDATGAAELSLAVAKSGGQALVVTDRTDPQFRASFPVVVWNTQTRNLDARQTARRTQGLKTGPLKKGEWSYLKMDSTLRGQWLAAIQARAADLQPDLILIAPALPAQGRGTRKGVHGLLQPGGKVTPLHETIYRDQIDPGIVEAGSDLKVYLQQAGVRSVELLGQGTIGKGGNRGGAGLLRRLRQMAPGTIVVADAVAARRLQNLARAIKSSGRSVLCCGSAGLYEALVPEDRRHAIPVPWRDPAWTSHPESQKILVLAGSHHPVSQTQVQRALDRFPDRVTRVVISTKAVQFSRTRPAEIRRVNRAIQQAWGWQRKQAVILELDRAFPLEPGSPQQRALGEFVQELLVDPGTADALGLLVVFGGDTLDTVLRTFKTGFQATAEMAPQIPYGYLFRFDRPALPTVTKGGGFGRPDFLEDLLERFSVPVKPRLAVTLGDPAGTGPELLLRALIAEPRLLVQAELLVVGDAGVLRRAKKMFKIGSPEQGITIHPIERPDQAQFIPGQLNVLDLKNVDPVVLKRTFGPVGVSDVSPRTRRHLGKAALQYLDAAIELASAGEVDGLMTLPVTKEDVALVEPGFRGHTEWLGKKLGTLSGSGEVSIALIHDKLRVLHVTMHRSLEEVVREFKNPAVTDRILEMIRVADQMGRRYFGLANPRIGVLGLNPHAGEGGLLGSEDKVRIQPAIDRALAEGLNVDSHPIPGDTAFTPGIRDRYDFLIAMYHDQGHAPFKALAAFSGINFTGNLAKVRTTPDHGTDRRSAYNPQREVQPTAEGVIAALQSAIDMVRAEQRLSAGAEEGWTRREILGLGARATIFAGTGDPKSLDEILRALIQAGIPVDDGMKKSVQVVRELVGEHESPLERSIAAFRKDPTRTVLLWERSHRSWLPSKMGLDNLSHRARRSSPVTYPEVVVDSFISGTPKTMEGTRAWLEFLDRDGTSSPLMVPRAVASELSFYGPAAQRSDTVDLLPLWRESLQGSREWLDAVSMESLLEALQDRGLAEKYLRYLATRKEAAVQKLKALERFAKLPLLQQRQIVQAVLRARLQFLESIVKEVPVVQVEAKRLTPHWERQMRWRDSVVQDRVKVFRKGLESAPIRVPDRAVFIGFIPRSGGDSFLDDWNFLERMLKKNPETKGLTLELVRLAPGEDPVTKALSIARQQAVPGSQTTVGFALGVLSEKQAIRLHESWFPRRTTADPWLAYSAWYIPTEVLQAGKSRRGDLLPTFSSQFMAWVQNPSSWVSPVVPEITLPLELWSEFRRQLISQAGLEQAA